MTWKNYVWVAFIIGLFSLSAWAIRPDAQEPIWLSRAVMAAVFAGVAACDVFVAFLVSLAHKALDRRDNRAAPEE